MTEENSKSIIIKKMMIMIIATRCENTGKTKVKKAEASGAPEMQILGKAASWRILTVYDFQLSLVFFFAYVLASRATRTSIRHTKSE